MRALSAHERHDVEAVIPLVRVIVARWLPKVPAHLERHDLFQAAMEAVCRARLRWDPDAGTKFSTFAVYRAEGALLDYLRSERPGTRAHPTDAPASLDEVITHRGRGDSHHQDLRLVDTLEAPARDGRPLDALHLIADELARMPAHQAGSFRRCVLNQMPQREEAALEGITESAIAFRLRLARARLAPIADAALAA